MQIGLIGLDRMGSNMSSRWLDAGHAGRELYRYQLDIPAVTEAWRRGRVVASWLLDPAAGSLARGGDLSTYQGRVSDSGEGRWTSVVAIDVGAPAPVLTTALDERLMSRGEADFADRVLSAMRLGFGGHEEGRA